MARAFSIPSFVRGTRPANRVARAIRQVLPDGDGVVAPMLSFGASAVAGYLGAMKTGLPSVRLDPVTSVGRNRKALADAGACLWVTNAAHLRMARSLAGGKIDQNAPRALAGR